MDIDKRVPLSKLSTPESGAPTASMRLGFRISMMSVARNDGCGVSEVLGGAILAPHVSHPCFELHFAQVIVMKLHD